MRLDTAESHGSPRRPVPGAVGFPNEVMSRHPDAISRAPGAPHPSAFGAIGIERFTAAFPGHLVERGWSRERARCVLSGYGPARGVISTPVAEARPRTAVRERAVVITVGAQEGMLGVRELLRSRATGVLDRGIRQPCRARRRLRHDVLSRRRGGLRARRAARRPHDHGHGAHRALTRAVIGGMLLEHGGSPDRRGERTAPLRRRDPAPPLDALDRCPPHSADHGSTWNRPHGGFFVRTRPPVRAGLAPLERRVVTCRVGWTPSDRFHLDGGGYDRIGLACGCLGSGRIEEGVRRLADFLDKEICT